jgi:hypothetical protein
MNTVERPKRDHAPEERWQHGADRAETNGTQHVASTIAALRRSNKIGDAEVVAAGRFYADFAFASGARDPEKGGSGGGADGYSAAQIDAITHWNAAVYAIGAFNAVKVEQVVIFEISIRSLAGGKGGRDHGKETAKVCNALKTLSDHYAKLDGSRPGRASPIRAASVDRDATISLAFGGTDVR